MADTSSRVQPKVLYTSHQRWDRSVEKKYMRPNEKIPLSEVERYWFHGLNLSDPEEAQIKYEEFYDSDEGRGIKFISAHQEPTEATYFGISCGVIVYCISSQEPECLIIERPSRSPAFPGDLAIPAGYIQKGESLENCALRQIKDLLPDSTYSYLSLDVIIDSVPNPKTHNLMFVYRLFLKEKVDLSSMPNARYMTKSEITKIVTNSEVNGPRFTPGFSKLFDSSRTWTN